MEPIDEHDQERFSAKLRYFFQFPKENREDLPWLMEEIFAEELIT